MAQHRFQVSKVDAAVNSQNLNRWLSGYVTPLSGQREGGDLLPMVIPSSFLSAHVFGMTLVVKQDKALVPADLGVFGAVAQVVEPPPLKPPSPIPAQGDRGFFPECNWVT